LWLGRATGGCTGTSAQHRPPPRRHLLCKIRSDKSKARENQDMTVKDNIRPSLLNYLPSFCHVSFAPELSAPTPHQPASITLPLNFQSPGLSPAKLEGFPMCTWRVSPLKALNFPRSGHPQSCADAVRVASRARELLCCPGVGRGRVPPCRAPGCPGPCPRCSAQADCTSRSGIVSATPSQAEDTSTASPGINRRAREAFELWSATASSSEHRRVLGSCERARTASAGKGSEGMLAMQATASSSPSSSADALHLRAWSGPCAGSLTRFPLLLWHKSGAGWQLWRSKDARGKEMT